MSVLFCEQYLPHVIPLAFSSCNLDDGSAVDIDESDDENINGFGEVSSDDEAHDEPRVRNISIRTGVLDEKAAATQALGLFAQHTKSSFSLYPCIVLFIYFLIDCNILFLILKVFLSKTELVLVFYNLMIYFQNRISYDIKCLAFKIWTIQHFKNDLELKYLLDSVVALSVNADGNKKW